MLNEDIGNSVIDTNLDNQSEELGFVVESWDDDKDTAPMEIPNTVFDQKSPTDFFNAERTDFGLSIMSGIAQYGVKPIVDAVTALSYGATNLALKGKFETPTAKEMEEETTLLPKSMVNYEPQTTAGAIAKPIAGMAYGVAATSAGLGAAGITGKAGVITNATLKGITKSKDGIAVGKILAPLINGIAANGLSFWEDEGNLSNLLQPHVKNPTIKSIVDYMALKEDDTAAERIMKQSLEGGFVGLAAEGISGIFKGLKGGYKYIRGKKAITDKSNIEIAEKLYEPIVEKPETAEEIAKKVAEGTRIEPGNDVVQQIVTEIKADTQKLGVSVDDIAIPRNTKIIDEQAARNKVAMALSDFVDIDNPEDMKKFSDFVTSAENPVESVLAHLKVERDTMVGGWMKLKAASKNAENAGVTLSNAEKTDALVDFLKSSAKGRGKALDDLYKDAKPMNIASKDIAHKANKKLFQEIELNADEIASPELFDILNSAQTEDELVSKMNSFFANASNAVTKGGFDMKKFVALEQAGLMSSTDTIIRNAFTSIENLTLGVFDDLSESLINKVSTEAVKNGANARDFIDIYAKGAAYANYLKDSAEWGLHQASRVLDKTIPTKASPWSVYRKNLPRQLTTNLPTEIGHTFSNEGNLGRMANGYIKYSGIGVSEATDSFFDAGFFRGSAAARVNSQARRLKKLYNLTDEQTRRIGKTMLDNIVNIDTTRRAYDIAEVNEAILAGIEKSVSKKSSLEAAEMTFRGGQGILTKGLTAAVNKIPLLKIFTPFVKTSSTIVFDRFIYDRTPYGLLYEGGKTLLSYLSPNIKSQLTNPALRNKFLAKQAVGASFLTLGAALYANGKITGDYSSDPEARKVQMASGWQPNSWVSTKEDGTLEFTSLNNFGVLSMLLKVPAKIAGYYNDSMRKTAKQEKIDEAETAFLSNCVGASIMLGEALAEETVLRNVSDFFDRLHRGFPDEESKKNALINLSTNPAKNIVPRLFRQLLGNKDFEEITKNNFESLKKTFEGLPVKHDVFGDLQERADFTKGLAGLSVKELKPNERYKGLMVKYGLSVPGVNKIEFPTKGHSVHLQDDYQIDRVYTKMGELGVGDAIKDIVMDIPKNISENELKLYQEQINRIYNLIKKQALQELVLENDDIGENYNQRIDFDMNEKYNIDKPVPVIPSLADY